MSIEPHVAMGVDVLPPVLALPSVHLDDAQADVRAAIALLQRAQEVPWRSLAADRFKHQLFVTIQDVRGVAARLDNAQWVWDDLVRVARANGQ